MKFRLISTSALLLLGLASAQAATIYELDFESGNVPSGISLNVVGGSATTSFSTSNSAGVGGSSALVATYDVTAPSAFYFRYEFNDSTPLNAATSENPADYTVSFDIRAVGLIVPAASGSLNINFNGYTVMLTSPAFDLTDTFQTISFTLDEFSPLSGTFSAAAANENVGFLYEIFQTNTKFGDDAGNQIIVDNFSVTQTAAIPEPAAFATLAGLGALALGALRRRRA